MQRGFQYMWIIIFYFNKNSGQITFSGEWNNGAIQNFLTRPADGDGHPSSPTLARPVI